MDLSLNHHPGHRLLVITDHRYLEHLPIIVDRHSLGRHRLNRHRLNHLIDQMEKFDHLRECSSRRLEDFGHL